MLKKMVARAGFGLEAGVALEHVIALVTSVALNLGYYSPCLVSLPERVGGEINAVLWQMGASALLCAVIGAASVFLGMRNWRARTRWLAFGMPVVVCLLAIVLLYLL